MPTSDGLKEYVGYIWIGDEPGERSRSATPAVHKISRPPLPEEGHTGSMATTTLYRPVGQPELDLIAASKWQRFPPRLDWQPIFYPVLNEAYATRIAREWNTKDDANGNVGYVLRFKVDTDYLAQFDIQQVGDDDCLEYWIPAQGLEMFNDHIRGEIEVVSEWRAK